MGAWIETFGTYSVSWNINVAPHVGAWIETGKQEAEKHLTKVAPHVGAWIETYHLIAYA